jgi:hypothetical protein
MNIKESYSNRFKSFFRDNARKGLIGIVLGSCVLFGGCSGEFWKTDFIEQNMKKVFEKRQNIEDTYRRESGVQVIKHPKKDVEPMITRNADNTYTLFYKCQFVDTSKLEKILKEQVPSCVISVADSSNQLIIKFPSEAQIDYVRGLLYNSDRMPSQVLLKLSIYNDYGDHTRDFATHLDILKGAPGFTSETTANYPGASIRGKDRENMGTKYGIGFENKNFTIKAILDVLESMGYVQQVYQTTMLLPNKEKGNLEEEETLPIPTYVVAGQNVVQTYKLESIKSFFEATPTIYDNGTLKLTFRAGIGSSKRPEGPIQWPVPVKDQVEIANVYLKVGQPFIVAGKANQLEMGVKRKDPMTSLLGGKDWERRVSRVWYEVTPFKIIYTEEGMTSGKSNPDGMTDPNSMNPESQTKFNLLFE